MRYNEIVEAFADRRTKDQAEQRAAIQSANKKTSENLTRYQIKMRAADDSAKLARMDTDPKRQAERLRTIDDKRAAARKVYGAHNARANRSIAKQNSSD